jgi:hypothetical protein
MLTRLEDPGQALEGGLSSRLGAAEKAGEAGSGTRVLALYRALAMNVRRAAGGQQEGHEGRRIQGSSIGRRRAGRFYPP